MDGLGGLSCRPGVCVTWSGLGVVSATWGRFGPFGGIVLLTVPGRCFFCGSFVSCVCPAFPSVHCYLIVACWEGAGLLALGCVFVTFPCGVLACCVGS